MATWGLGLEERALAPKFQGEADARDPAVNSEVNAILDDCGRVVGMEIQAEVAAHGGLPLI